MPPARRVPVAGGGWLTVHEQAAGGPTLLLLHGFTDCAESYRLLLPHLAGCHLVIPDLRGHGTSFRGPIGSLDTLAGDVEAVADALGLRRVLVVGHSMGALVAITLAARGRVDLSGLVTISGSLRPAGPSLQALAGAMAALPDPLAVSHPFLDEWYACSRPVPAPFLARLRASCVAMRRQDWLDCLAMLDRADLRAVAGRLALASVVLSGSEDAIFAPDHQRGLVKALRPQRNVVFSGVGHNPHWEVPDEVAAVLRAAAVSAAALQQG